MKKFVIIALTVVALSVAAAAFFGSDSFRAGRLINRIKTGQNVNEAREELKSLGDAGLVLDKIKDALADEGDTVTAKINLLYTLTPQYFNQGRIIERSIGSKVESTRRAAAWVLYGDATLADQCRTIALDWLRDGSADARPKAVLMVRRLEAKEATPDLMAILEKKPEKQEDIDLILQALQALGDFHPEGLADELMAMAESQTLNDNVKSTAIDTLSRLDDAPRAKIQSMAIRLLENKKNSTLMRSKMASVLRRDIYANDEVWSALERVALDPEESDHITQRSCFRTFAEHLPIDRLKRLLEDRRVYRHPYFALRMDVASMCAALNMRERDVVQVMAEYLIDEDPQDTGHQVRLEGWITLWQLTGVVPGIEAKDLFSRAPTPIRDPEMQRHALLAHEHFRAGIRKEQVDAMKKVIGDLPEMKRVRDLYLNPATMARVQEEWAAQEKTRLEEAANARKKKDADAAPVGPVAPKPPGGADGEDGDAAPDDGE